MPPKKKETINRKPFRDRVLEAIENKNTPELWKLISKAKQHEHFFIHEQLEDAVQKQDRQKLEQLIKGGANIYYQPPSHSPSPSPYAEADKAIKKDMRSWASWAKGKEKAVNKACNAVQAKVDEIDRAIRKAHPTTANKHSDPIASRKELIKAVDLVEAEDTPNNRDRIKDLILKGSNINEDLVGLTPGNVVLGDTPLQHASDSKLKKDMQGWEQEAKEREEDFKKASSKAQKEAEQIYNKVWRKAAEAYDRPEKNKALTKALKEAGPQLEEFYKKALQKAYGTPEREKSKKGTSIGQKIITVLLNICLFGAPFAIAEWRKRREAQKNPEKRSLLPSDYDPRENAAASSEALQRRANFCPSHKQQTQNQGEGQGQGEPIQIQGKTLHTKRKNNG